MRNSDDDIDESTEHTTTNTTNTTETNNTSEITETSETNTNGKAGLNNTDTGRASSGEATTGQQESEVPKPADSGVGQTGASLGDVSGPLTDGILNDVSARHVFWLAISITIPTGGLILMVNFLALTDPTAGGRIIQFWGLRQLVNYGWVFLFGLAAMLFGTTYKLAK